MQLDSHAADLLHKTGDLGPFEVFFSSFVRFPCIYALPRAQGAHLDLPTRLLIRRQGNLTRRGTPPSTIKARDSHPSISHPMSCQEPFIREPAVK